MIAARGWEIVEVYTDAGISGAKGREKRPGFDRRIEMAHATMRGLALLDTLHPGGGRNRRQWPHCRAQLVEMFEEMPTELEETRATVRSR